MNSKYVGFVIGFVMVWAALASWVGYYVKNHPDNVNVITQERIFYIRQGAVYCNKSEETACGLTLSQCANDMDYKCMNDVGIKVVE